MPVKVMPTGRVAVAAVDPGETTGLFAGVVELSNTMKETATTLSDVLVKEVVGDFRTQAVEIDQILGTWFACRTTINSISRADQHLVFEDFVLRRRRQGGATGNLTSCWVAAAVDALMTCGSISDGAPGGSRTGQLFDGGERVTYYQPGMAKGYATNERLKLWTMYRLTRGKPHARDASRHWAMKVNELIG